MTATALAVLTLLGSYLIGAVPFGYAVARWRGIDIFRQGSGNIGATNVGRVLGRRFGILVFVLDFFKGALPVTAAVWSVRTQEELIASLGPDGLPVLAGLAAFLGHIFPVFLRFKGGKGVATGAGVVAVLLPGPALGALLAWIVVVCASRYVSLASLSAALVLCVLRLVLTPLPFDPPRHVLTWFCFLAAGLVALRHHANIRRLLQGSESRLPESSAMLTRTKVLHVLALGLWFGSSVFLNLVVARVLFAKFESLALSPKANSERAYLQLPEHFSKEMGTRLAGAAVAPLFPWFHMLEWMCGVIVVVTALVFYLSERRTKVHRIRFMLAMLALATVPASMALASQVSRLRFQRFDPDPIVAASAQAEFFTWHTCSVLLGLVTLAFVAVALALAAKLPAGNDNQLAETEEKKSADRVPDPALSDS